MSYVPDFENDLFISYAHIDNQPLTKDQEGWIDEFHRALEVLLQQRLGERPQIWRDPKLQGNDIFGDELAGKFSQAAILVSVFSPRYVKSDWCLKELREFMKSAEQKRGFRIGNKARVFKVVKTVVPGDQAYPPEVQSVLQTTLGYEFFQIDKATGRPIDFRPEKDLVEPEAFKSFYARLNDLACDICQLLDTLKSLKGDLEKVAAKPPSGLPSIYLAETTFDLGGERDKIRRELQERGYAVLPDKSLPFHAAEFQKMVRAYLAECKLSVHLIGENYGVIPEGETRSVAHLQNELAAERSRNSGFSRLLWMPAGLQAKEDRQQEFIKYLQNDAAAQKGAELLLSPLEELKTIIQDKLSAGQKPAMEPAGAAGPLRLYLICDQRDVEATAPLQDYLFAQGFEVILPAFAGEETQVREDHQENLLLCDAPLIYCGNANELWLRGKLRDLQKIAGYGRAKPMRAKAIYVGPPETSQKQQFRTHEALVIKNFAAFSPESLQPFLAQIAPGK